MSVQILLNHYHLSSIYFVDFKAQLDHKFKHQQIFSLSNDKKMIIQMAFIYVNLF